MSKVQLIVSSTFISIQVFATGRNDSGGKSKTNPVSKNPRSNLSEPKVNLPAPGSRGRTPRLEGVCIWLFLTVSVYLFPLLQKPCSLGLKNSVSYSMLLHVNTLDLDAVYRLSL